MSATDRLLSLLSGVRRIGESRWMARCSAHQDRFPSLSIRQAEDRVLLRCWAGCTAEEVVAAIGLSLADLFNNRKNFKTDPITERKRRAAQALEKWHQAELQRDAEDLRARDVLVGVITRKVQTSEITEVEAWRALQYAYDHYNELEYRFERLLHDRDVLQMWRESRRSHASKH